MVRALVLSQVRFCFRNPPWHQRTPRRTFGTSALATVERPWPNATTGELVSRMEWHAGVAGNAYVTRRPDRLRVLRPDWTGVVYGSELEPDYAGHALDGEIIGYAYCNGGFHSGNKVHTLLPKDVAHWSPLPDPESPGMGMSWVTPAIRDLRADLAATEHKLQFFTHGATPNMVVKGIPAATKEQFDEIVDAMEARHAGLSNAYRTLYLTAGADATVVGKDLQQIDFKATQGAGETRLSVLSRVPASLLGISEGLSGSSLNAGNFSSARRSFGDTWVTPTLQDLCSALSTIVAVPNDAELWFDLTDMPILREDAKDAAEIFELQARSLNLLVQNGWKPEPSKAATIAQDVSLLQHSGLLSVQLQPIGKNPQLPPTGQPPQPPQLPPAQNPTRASDLAHGPGAALWDYWTKGEGLGKWAAAEHKWSTLHAALLAAGVPAAVADGLTTNIIEHVFPGYMKQVHEQH
jgi:phage portal protein BeeE